MAYRGPSDRGYINENAAPRETGARRKKLAGYLRAANELRQTYVQTWNKGEDQELQDGDLLDFTNVAKVSSGEEQMILFPSYAKTHVKESPSGPATGTPAAAYNGAGTGTGDADFWRKQWEQYENDRAVVDVDVRGWLFTPQKGPMSRKHRLMVALARQLAGIPAPTTGNSPSSTVASSRQSSPTRVQSIVQDDQLLSQQADAIIQKGEAESQAAGLGAFSERPAELIDGQDGEFTPATPSRRQTLDSNARNGAGSQDVPISSIPLTAAELTVANTNLLTRLKPFMSNPLVGSTINVFFYNETMSRQRTVTTDPYGHFSFRAALEFLPTHIRVLASEDLSLQEPVNIVASKGVSLISDVDDTIRHSAITKGAREIFRNAFVRDMGELTIVGVKDWYNKLSSLGVQIHYVSNSPWQLYPAMTSFFSAAGLPKGSFHLKQYSGMLQGIFEPVAERKKATLERIFRDFPDRKFILAGDSGEADLEVYTDIVIDYPGRVLGVFIRDVTSPPTKGFFDPSLGPLNGSSTPNGTQSRHGSVDSSALSARSSRRMDRSDDDPALKAAIAASLKDMEMHGERGPALPPRRSNTPGMKSGPDSENELGDLIDFGDEDITFAPYQSKPKGPAPSVPRKPIALGAKTAASRPPPPSKPTRLRSTSNASSSSVQGQTRKDSVRTAPPLPRKSSTSVKPASPSPLHQMQPSASESEKQPALPERQTYRNMASQKINAAYNALPAASTLLSGYQGTVPLPSTFQSTRGGMDSRSMYSTRRPTADDRTDVGSVNRQGSYWSGQESGDDSYGHPINKKEEMWRRRWIRAKDIMDRYGVMLRAWRVGADVMDECVKVVQAELERMHGKGDGKPRPK